MTCAPDLPAAWRQLALWLAAAFASGPRAPEGWDRRARAALCWLERIARRLVVLEALERLAGVAGTSASFVWRRPDQRGDRGCPRPVRPASRSARGFRLVEGNRSVPFLHPAPNRRPRITLMTPSAARPAPPARGGDPFAGRLAALQAVIAAPERTIRRAMRHLLAGRRILSRGRARRGRRRGLDPLLIARADALDHEARWRLARAPRLSPPP